MFTGFPEPLIQHIQSFLTSEEAARTTLLSKSWRTAWLTRPNLDFDQAVFSRQHRHDFSYSLDPEFLEFAEKTLERYDNPNLKIDSFGLRIKIPNHCHSDHATNLILRALEYGPTRLSLEIKGSDFHIPDELFRYESLLSLTVYGWCRVYPNRDEVRWSSLQLLSLESVSIESRATIFQIVSSCPLIEKLSLCYVYVDHVDVDDVDRTIISPPLHRLKSLVLKNVAFDTLFLADLSSKFPSLKDLTLHINNDREEILISSPTLERLDFNMGFGYSYKALRVELDVPSIRKLTFDCASIPELSLKTNSKGWEESCVSLTRSKCVSASWFYTLSNFLNKLRLSRVFLSLHVYSRDTFDYKGRDIHSLPTPEIENLKIYHEHLPSISCYALFDGLFRICHPKVITQYKSNAQSCVRSETNNNIDFLWERLLEARDAKFPTPNYQFMYGLNDLKEARAQVFDAAVSTWRDVTLDSLLDENSTTIEESDHDSSIIEESGYDSSIVEESAIIEELYDNSTTVQDYPVFRFQLNWEK